MTPVLLASPLIHLYAGHETWTSPVAEHSRIWAVLRGSGQLKIQQTSYALRSGVVCLFRPGMRAEATQSPEDPLLVYSVSFAGSSPSLRRFPDPPAVNEVLDMSCLEALARMTVSAWQRGDARGRLRAAHGVEQILLQLVDEEQRRGLLEPDDRVSRLVARIDAEPALRLSLREMAASCHMSTSTFHRVFRGMTGHSPVDYMVLRRIQHAKHLLWETNLHVGEIAQALGYEDIAYFSRQFKQKTGDAPAGFRSGNRRDHLPDP